MTRKLLAALLVMALLGAAPRARADSASAGAQPFSFLGLDSSARAAALGGAYTALAVDADALQYNPAGLALQDADHAAFMHNQYFESANQDHVAVALKSGFGASFDMLNYGAIKRTTYSSPDGGRGTFGIMDTSLNFGYGRAFGPAAFGGAAKWLRESNDGLVGQGGAVDGGALFDVPGADGLRLGFSVLNLGAPVRFQAASEGLPATARLGGAWGFALPGYKNTLALDLLKQGTDKPRLAFGAETAAAGGLSLRLGYTTRIDAGIGLTAGVGWKGDSWSFDYAIAPYGDLGLTHRVGAGLRWGQAPAPEAPAKMKYRRDGDDPRELREARLQPRAESALPPVKPAPGAAAKAGPASRYASLLGVGSPAETETAEHIAKSRRLTDSGLLVGARAELDKADQVLGPEDRLRVAWNEAQGRWLRAKKQPAQARAAYTEALRLAAKLGAGGQVVADCYEGLGDILIDQGDVTYGLKFFNKAYQIAPSDRLLEAIEAYERDKR